jgi:hypothetical protein
MDHSNIYITILMEYVGILDCFYAILYICFALMGRKTNNSILHIKR